MKSFVVRANNNQERFTDVQFKGAAETYSFDLLPWVDDNNAVTSATWTVEHGQAAISGETLSSSVATALVTFAQDGANLIKVVFDTGTEKYVVWLDVVARDLTRVSVDYLSSYYV